MIKDVFDGYLRRFPEEKRALKLLRKQIDELQKLNGRKNFVGHITGSAIVLSPRLDKVLAIHHIKLKRWQQPGGHWDEDETGPWLTAFREAQEETGVKIAKKVHLDAKNPHIPLDIDSHYIPAIPVNNEPSHHHHDFRHVFIAEGLELQADKREVYGVEWLPFDDPRTAIFKCTMDKLRLLKL